MNALRESHAFHVSPDSAELTIISEEEAAPLERGLLEELERLPGGSVLPLDLAGVRLSSESARQLLRRALRRLSSGELDDRFLVIQNLRRGRYSVEAMLKLEGLTVVERVADGHPPQLLGKVDSVVKETYDFLVRNGDATARDLVDEFALKTVSAATNRLTNLTSLAVARRTAPESLPAGGVQFRYVPVR